MSKTTKEMQRRCNIMIAFFKNKTIGNPVTEESITAIPKHTKKKMQTIF